MNLRNLNDQELLAGTKKLVTSEREILTQVLWHLAEIQRRKLFSPRYTSLFAYSTMELGYSEDEAARRISAMRLLVEIPEIESKVSSGALTLTKLGMAQTFFRAEAAALRESAITGNATNSESKHSMMSESKIATLTMIEGKSTRETWRLLDAASGAPEKLRPESIRPLKQELNELKITVKNATLDKIAQLKGRLAHSHPYLSTAELLDIALDIAIHKTEPKDLDSKQPLSTLGRNPGSALRRQIWRRAQGKCELCESVHALEVDHVKPFALGGLTNSDNLRLLCRNCNQRESFKFFGDRRVTSENFNRGAAGRPR